MTTALEITHYSSWGMKHILNCETGKKVWLTEYVPLDEAINQENPPLHQSCDWIDDPLALGLQVFPLRTYEILRELRRKSDATPIESSKTGNCLPSDSGTV